mmetsp:Transcript_20025/g.47855  ORF Transcript_20025/g.47855 Transcript_20025/m.47855 type:complete len:287 (+) Transcript_20025:513-1373(+)
MRALASNLGCVVGYMTPIKKLSSTTQHTTTTDEDPSTQTLSGEFSFREPIPSILVSKSSSDNHNNKKKKKDGLWRSGTTRKRVRFDLKLTKLRPNPLKIDAAVAERLWFKTGELQEMKREHIELTRVFFRSTRRLQKEEEKQVQVQAIDEDEDEAVENDAPADDNQAAVSQSDGEEYWKDTFLRAYVECRRAKKNGMEACGKVDQASLVKLYQTHEELVGMEKYILYMLRGDITKQVKRILNSVDQFCEGSEEAFVKECRSMTQPSIRLVQELAAAQSAAMSLPVQ